MTRMDQETISQLIYTGMSTRTNQRPILSALPGRTLLGWGLNYNATNAILRGAQLAFLQERQEYFDNGEHPDMADDPFANDEHPFIARLADAINRGANDTAFASTANSPDEPHEFAPGTRVRLSRAGHGIAVLAPVRVGAPGTLNRSNHSMLLGDGWYVQWDGYGERWAPITHLSPLMDANPTPEPTVFSDINGELLRVGDRITLNTTVEAMRDIHMGDDFDTFNGDAGTVISIEPDYTIADDIVAPIRIHLDISDIAFQVTPNMLEHA